MAHVFVPLDWQVVHGILRVTDPDVFHGERSGPTKQRHSVGSAFHLGSFDFGATWLYPVLVRDWKVCLCPTPFAENVLAAPCWGYGLHQYLAFVACLEAL